MEIELGLREVSQVSYVGMEGVQNGPLEKSKRDSITISQQIEGRRDSITVREKSDLNKQGELPFQPAPSRNIIARIFDCIKHFCCCCCFRRPQQENFLNALDGNSTTNVFRALQEAQNAVGNKENAIDEVYQLVEAGSDLSISREESTGHSFFHLATQFPGLLDYLIKNGKMDDIDINSFLDNNGTTPLGYAILCSQETPDKTLASSFLLSAKYLLEWKGRLDVSIGKGINGTILHYVVMQRIEALFPIIRKNRDDLNSVSYINMSPLCLALYNEWINEFIGQQKPNCYQQIARLLFNENAKVLYTNEGIRPDHQQPFRQFVEKHGFGNALMLNVDVED